MDLKSILMGLAFALMWSSAFTSARMIVADAPPLTSLALRFLVSGLIGITIAKALGQRLALSKIQWRNTAIFGICQNAIYLGFNFVAMQWIEASLAAIVASTMPLIVALAGWALFGERLRALGYAGLLAGLIGVAIIMGSRLSGGVDVTGLVLAGVGAAALAFATLMLRGASAGGNLLMIVGIQMLIGSAALTVAAVALESWSVTWSLRLALAFSYTTLVPGLLATWRGACGGVSLPQPVFRRRDRQRPAGRGAGSVGSGRRCDRCCGHSGGSGVAGDGSASALRHGAEAWRGLCGTAETGSDVWRSATGRRGPAARLPPGGDSFTDWMFFSEK